MSFFDMDSVVREFENQIPAEFNFLREAEMMTRVRQNLKAAAIFDVVVPRLLPGLVSREALTMTFIDGCRPDNAVAMNLWGINPTDVLKAVGRAFGQMLLCDGVAHCDRKCFAFFCSCQLIVLRANFDLTRIYTSCSDAIEHTLLCMYPSLINQLILATVSFSSSSSTPPCAVALTDF